MKQIISHKVNGLNEAIDIYATDEKGAGGAHHVYELALMQDVEPKEGCTRSQVATKNLTIEFQNGPIKEAGYNGWSIEALLAIAEDRLVCFQAGQFACRENAIALTKIQEALMWLQKRTLDRVRRGVEGTNTV